MENLWMLYLITRLDSVINFLDTVQYMMLMTSIFLVVSFVFVGEIESDEEKAEKSKRTLSWWLKCSVVLFILTGITKVVLPSKEDVMFIAAGVGITEVVKSEEAKRIASGSVKVVEAWLAKQEKELKKETK